MHPVGGHQLPPTAVGSIGQRRVQMRGRLSRIQGYATAVALLLMDAAVAQQLTITNVVNTTARIENSHLHARVATYRNGFGTHFQCTASCYFLMWAYLACVAALLALLFVIPVKTPMKPENAPFVLWLDSNQSADHDDSLVKRRKNKTRPKQQYGLLDWLSMWVYGYEEPESSESEEESESSHTDIDLVTEPTEPVKTFESIGVETDDSLLPTLAVYTEPEQVDTQPPSPPPSPHEKKPGIFAPVTPRGANKEAGDFSGTDAEPPVPLPRQASVSAVGSGRGLAAGRRSTVVGSASDVPADSLLAAVERRTSMHKRAEKRKAYAKSDIAHDNLHEHEFHMYEYLEFVRCLLEGLSLKKITQKSGEVVKRTFFITPNLATVYWNQVGNKSWVSKKSSIESTEISHVTKGADGASASRLKPEKQELCLTIVMNDGKRLVLGTKDEAMRQRLVLGFTRLAAEKKEEKRKKDAGETDELYQQDEVEDDQDVALEARRKQQQVLSQETEQRADDPKDTRRVGNQEPINAAVMVSEEEEKEEKEEDD